MRYMPDSAVLGTVGHAKRRVTKARRRSREAHPITQVIFWVAFVIVVAVFVL